MLPPEEQFVPPIGYGAATKKVDPAITVSLVPLGVRTIYVVDPTTGNVRTDLPYKFVLWTNAPFPGSNYNAGGEYSLYMPEGLFSQVSQDGISRPNFIYSYNATEFDGTMSGTAASWAGYLARTIWMRAAKSIPLIIRNASQVALPTNLPYLPFGSPYSAARWVLPEIIEGKTYLKDVNIILAKDTKLALTDIGIFYSVVYGSDSIGKSVAGGLTPSIFCTLGDNYGLKVILETNGLVNTFDRAFIAAVGIKFQVIQVVHNKAPNYVALNYTPSTTLGAPLGAPLGG